MPCLYDAVTIDGVLLDDAEWQARKSAHEIRVRRFTDPHQARASRGEKHPVFDFLFSYYAFRPAWLRQWHPGPGLALSGHAAREFLRWPEYREFDAAPDLRVIALDLSSFPPGRRDFLNWLQNFLESTSARPPQFGCHGLHEWAMVYRQDARAARHSDWPFRFPSAKIAEIVESLPLRCTHFDAFRFFTPDARPLNRQLLERENVPANEQRGCLHAGMDLYKWAFKLAPFTPSDLLMDCFELAADIREVDMRASPYDLTTLGFAAIPIETSAGRGEYERFQRDFAVRGQPLRQQLLTLCTKLLAP